MKTKPSVLALVYRIPYPPTDGGRKAMLGMLVGLARSEKLSFQAFILTDLREPESSIAELKAMLGKADFVRMDQRNHVWAFVRGWIFGRDPYSLKKYASTAGLNVVRRRIQEDNVDIIFVEHLQSFWIAQRLKEEFPKLKIVLRAHNVETLVLERVSREARSITRRLLFRNQARRMERLEREAIRIADLVLAISEPDRQVFIRRFNASAERVRNVPVGLDAVGTRGKEKTPKLSDECLVLVVGSMDWEPNRAGLEWLLREVVPVVTRKDRAVRFLIVGKGTERLVIDPRDRVRVVGYVEDIEPFFDIATIAAVALHSGGGIRIKILDFMCRRIPVVTTTIGIEGIATPADHDHLALIADDAAAFASAILKMAGNPTLRAKIAASAYDHVCKTYDWQKIVSGVVDDLCVWQV